jgi:predicted phosphoribosyltransferase
MFFDRIHAGEILAAELAKFKDEKGVVLAVPRGGIPIAYVVAKTLDWPLDLLLTKKIGHPSRLRLFAPVSAAIVAFLTAAYNID